MALASKKSRGVGTTFVTAGGYAVPSSKCAVAIGITVANITSFDIAVDVTVYDGTTDTYIVKGATVVAGQAQVFSGGDAKLVLNSGESIRVKSNTAASADVILSILEDDV